MADQNEYQVFNTKKKVKAKFIAKFYTNYISLNNIRKKL